jgi:hypothetical protein
VKPFRDVGAVSASLSRLTAPSDPHDAPSAISDCEQCVGCADIASHKRIGAKPVFDQESSGALNICGCAGMYVDHARKLAAAQNVRNGGKAVG